MRLIGSAGLVFADFLSIQVEACGSSTGPSWPTWPGRPRRGHRRGRALHPADPEHPRARLLVPALLQPIPAWAV